ncbi:GNAT family N-acetyltransferase [Pontibacter sp. MBLB2868]|uniref:GNAT family N-acetyltransferase n=1 Tax=Pontibacter sp. MBLB2868 TaxID=3451555 RepID=UPI003F74BB56
MVEVVRYNETHKMAWDAFVKASKNGTFLHYRDYIEYHADRFKDHSLLFYRKGKLLGLFPANEQEGEINSHGGLTYGGLLSDMRMKSGVMLEVFERLRMYLQQQSFKKLRYKTVPHIYHRAPAEEDLLALFRIGATIYRRDLLSVLEPATVKYSKKRRWEITKSQQMHNLIVGRSHDFRQFIHVVADLLQRKYNAVPVHNVAEITSLATKFSEHIKLFSATDSEGVMLAGVLIYETDTVAHCQYIGYTEQGKLKGGLGVLLDYLLKEVFAAKPYFDLGASMEQNGLELNSKLLANKESYGARAVVQDFYELDL